MINWIKNGNIFRTKQDIIVLPVNCVGVMGAGLAKQAADLHPGLLDTYKAMCSRGEVAVGKPLGMVSSSGRDNQVRCFLMFPTKLHWKDPSRLEWVESGLSYLADMEKYKVSLAIPPLGCGLGKLKWADVKQRIEQKLSSPTLNVEVYCPNADL